MKRIILLLLLLTSSITTFSQNLQNEFQTSKISVNGEEFSYYQTLNKSNTVIVIFHDWFGISDLSFELLNWVKNENMDAVAVDLYQGKSATTHADAWKYMNSIDNAKSDKYIDNLLMELEKKYDNIILWGLSMGTVYASNASVRNSNLIDGLIVFYGDVPTKQEELEKMDFPILMAMGSKDNAKGAIDFFNSKTSEDNDYVTLILYPNVGHAFAQKLFADGKNYNEDVKVNSFQTVKYFIKSNILK